MTTKIANSASGDLGVDDWLDHGQGEGGKFFSLDWKQNDEYRIWLHRSPIRVMWRVVWKYINKGKLRLMRWNSMESPNILSKQNFKNDDGSHEHAPQVDPFAKLVEFVDIQMAAGNIGFVDEIFKFEPDDDDEFEEEIIHAGGFTGEFQSRKLEKDQRTAIRKAGVQIGQAFKESGKAQEETVFIVVDNENPGLGAQIATVGRGLAKEFKACVARRRTEFSKTPEMADPYKNPVCFSWSRDDSGDFPKYTVTATQDDLTDEIKEAIDSEAPDTRKMFEPSNVALLRQSFEKHWCHEVTPDWDEIFGAALEAVAGTDAAELPESFNHGANVSQDDEEDKKPAKKPEKPATVTKLQSKKAPEPAPEPEELPPVSTCDACDGIMGDEVFQSDPVVCPHCGAKYEYDETEEEYKIVKAPAEEPKKEAKPAIRASRRQVEK